MLKKEFFRTILPFLILWGMCFPALYAGDCLKGNPPWDMVSALGLMGIAFLLAHGSRNHWRQIEAAEAEAKAKAAAKAKAENAEAEAEAKAETEG